ncbi:helix-turn-helix domain-containing protein [Angustibacter luteus]|uniref:Helix-turn-helix domain-containing protein n=1 Tax=Angustibacter luteus TaxID=658456 RepID=A0ABW1JCH8_9ACTN
MTSIRADLGEYLKEQRHSAKLSLRQLGEAAGVSNPYLSQIERGLKKPSAEILQSLAKGLRISAESLYVRAGILDEQEATQVEVKAAILGDLGLNERQKRVLLDIYESFCSENDRTPADAAPPAAPRQRATTKAASTKPTATKKATAKAATKTTAKKSTAKKTSTARTTRKPTT